MFSHMIFRPNAFQSVLPEHDPPGQCVRSPWKQHSAGARTGVCVGLCGAWVHVSGCVWVCLQICLVVDGGRRGAKHYVIGVGSVISPVIAIMIKRRPPCRDGALFPTGCHGAGPRLHWDQMKVLHYQGQSWDLYLKSEKKNMVVK